MDILKLILPTMEYAGQIMDYKAEMFAADSSMDGCGALRHCETAEEWLAYNALYTDPATLPEGKVLARHRGIHRYTLGQGRGLGVSGPHRYYVSAIDPENNTVTLSDGSDLFREEIFCVSPNWIAIPSLDGPMEVAARFRHAKTETACTLIPREKGILVKAHTPVRSPTPGQLAVFYDGDVVIGSAWIKA